MNKDIFKKYDIRGHKSDLSDEVIYKIIFAFTKFTKAKSNNKITIARDGRLTSERISIIAAKAIIDAGCEVNNIGVEASPVLYFADKFLNSCSAIMITASHNHKDDNGFKLLKNNQSFFYSNIMTLMYFIEDYNWKTVSTKHLDKYVSSFANGDIFLNAIYRRNNKNIDIKNQYLNNILKLALQSQKYYMNIESINKNNFINILENINMQITNLDVNSLEIDDINLNNDASNTVNNDSKFLIAIDSANAVGASYMNIFTKVINDNLNKFLNIIHINNVIDGNFPSHLPDPTKEKNLIELKNICKENKVDIAFAFDGDADRLVALTKNDQTIFGDRLLMILIFSRLFQKYLKKNNFIINHNNGRQLFDQFISYINNNRKKNNYISVILDIQSSEILINLLKEWGVQVILEKTGHSYIKKRCIKENVHMAAEVSGHIYFKENKYYDDAIYAFIKLIDIAYYFHQVNIQIDDILNILPKTYNQLFKIIPKKSSNKFEIIRNLQNKISDTYNNINLIDGMKVTEKDGWWLIRASNTENLLVIRCESFSKEAFDIIKNKILNSYLKNDIEEII